MPIGRHIHKKIGLSLSFCVKDILLERVPLIDIAVIVSGTNFAGLYEKPTDELVDEIMKNYYIPYWGRYSEGHCRFILRYLIHNHMLVQPRSRNPKLAPNIAKDIWLTYPTNEVTYR